MKFTLLSVDVEVYLCESLSWEKKLRLLLYLITCKTLKNVQKPWIMGKMLAKTLNWPWILVLKSSDSPDKALYSILSIWPNHCSLLSCKHSLTLFNFSLVISSCTELLSSGLTLYIHLTILAPFLSSLITSSSLTGQVPLPYSITLHTHVDHLEFLLHHPVLILRVAYSTTKVSSRPWKPWMTLDLI